MLQQWWNYVSSVNGLLSVLGAFVASFVLSLFYRITLEDASDTTGRLRLGMAYFLQLLVAFAMSMLVLHLGSGQLSLKHGWTAGFYGGLIAALSVMASQSVVGTKSRLVWLEGGYWILVLLVQGLLIGWIGSRTGPLPA